MKKLSLKATVLLVPIIALSLMQGCSKEEEAVDNSIKWSYTSGAAIHSSPVKFQENIIFGNDNKTLYSIDPSTQKEVWTFTADGTISSTPIVDGDKIIFSTFSTCYALDGKTGKELWHYTTTGNTSDTLGGYDYHAPSPILYKDQVVFTTEWGKIIGINKANGNKIWEWEAEGSSDLRSTPSISQDVLIIGDVKGNCFAMDLNTQKTLWKNKLGSTVIHTSLAHEDYAFFAGRDAKVYAYDIKTGTERWEYTDTVKSWFTGDMFIKDDLLYVPGSDSHRMAAIDYKNGKCRNSYYGDGNIFSSGVIVEDTLYFTYGDVYNDIKAGVVAFKLDEPDKAVFHSKFNKSIFSTPLVVGDMIYFGSTDGKLYAVEYTK